MQNIRTMLLLFCTLTSAAAEAEEFYVELGRTSNEQEANNMWSDLQQRYSFLADYDVYPNKILQFGGEFTYRVQAGPMLDKREANAVCRKLFSRKIACYVIEGFDPKNIPSFSDVTPARPEARIAQERAAPDESPLQLPWLGARPAQGSEGRVVVAEAIPVALTQEDNQVTVGAPIAVTPVASIESNENVFGSWFKRGGWLSIQPFLDESRAQRFWQNLLKKSPESAALTMQMIHPVVSHDVPKVILSVGQFASEDEAMAFCRNYVSASKVLECEFASEPPQGEAAKGLIQQKIANDEYSLFWVEVLSEKNQDKLLEKWERIRTDNDDLLADTRSQVTSSLSTSGTYVVRIGPLKTRSKASAMCKALQSRGLGCSLVSL